VSLEGVTEVHAWDRSLSVCSWQVSMMYSCLCVCLCGWLVLVIVSWTYTRSVVVVLHGLQYVRLGDLRLQAGSGRVYYERSQQPVRNPHSGQMAMA
jgi:hypothetical protein